MATRRSLPVFDGAGKVHDRADSPLWRSLAERLRGGPDRATVAAEFTPGAAAPPEFESGQSRRSFVQLMGASAALAGLSACVRKPHEQILPYTRQPENAVPGRPLHYATASFLGGHATGLLVTSSDGRPTKVEGNPDHPASRGATGLLDQAALLSLYDPGRAAVIKQRGQNRSWRTFLEEQHKRAAELKKDGGAGLRFLLEPSSSPSLQAMRQRLAEAFPKARFHSWSALGSDGAADAAEAAFGAKVDVRLDLSRATVIASLDDDLLSGLPGTLGHQRAFADRRAPGEQMNRLYSVEHGLTPTGGAADHRLAVKPSEMPAFAVGLLGRVARLSPKSELLARFADLNPALPAAQAKFADALAKDLVKHAGASLVSVGPRQVGAVHLAALAINTGLGNAGKTVSYANSALLDAECGPRSLGQLCADIKAGKVDTLVITANNPVYNGPADLDLRRLLAGVPNSIYLGLYEDETSAVTTWFLPAAHELECWGDGKAQDGTVTFQQPLIAPLFNGLTQADVLAALLGEGEKGALAHLRSFWDAHGAAEATWEKWIADGFAPGTATLAELSPRADALVAELHKPLPAASAAPLEVMFALDHKVYDGRFGNNAWLQEVPHPISRLSWTNAALVTPSTARKLNLNDNDVVEIKVGDRSVQAAVLVQPGQPPDTVQLNLGYGRTGVGESVAGGVGYNATEVRTSQGFWWAAGDVKPTGQKHELVTTQEHHSMEGRALALQTTLEEFEKGEAHEIAKNAGALPSLYEGEYKYDGYKWAMAIDLSRCTGCNACAVACQAENNIPVVGKEQVAKSREMHWLRVDRYYLDPKTEGKKHEGMDPEIRDMPDFPEMITQPVMCVQCENAPCEYVCPVNATVHSDEGLNDMVYNRCVGTRYCSNNCPYKVRRFNFFSYTTGYTDVEKMVMNPDVTVRARGVMEKCTYCVQRIERARIETRVAGRDIQDGEITTACQQACPSQAIVFGSLHDPNSKVSKLQQDPRRYDLLHELGTRPRTAYLARIKNTNPELA